jgi:hypothetical protein
MCIDLIFLRINATFHRKITRSCTLRPSNIYEAKQNKTHRPYKEHCSLCIIFSEYHKTDLINTMKHMKCILPMNRYRIDL